MAKAPSKRPPKTRPVEPLEVDAGWRLFIAVDVPPEVKELMRGVVDYVGGKDWPVRWTNPEIAHLTLHFLGDTAPERAELLRAALPKVVARHAPFELRTAGFGAFPNPHDPRVFWLGLDGQIPQLQALHRDISAVLRSLEFPLDDRPLRPHLTLGRLRDIVPPEYPEKFRVALADQRLQERLRRADETFSVEEVTLMRSYLGRNGAKHVPVVTAKLLGTGTAP